MAARWRQAFDLVERPLGAGAEAWVQSDTFMGLAAASFRVQHRLVRDVQRVSARWLELWGLPSREDAVRLMNQVGSLEREVRDLRRRLERSEADVRQRQVGASQRPAADRRAA